MTEEKITRRTWLLLRLIDRGTHHFVALEVVSSFALAHPEVDMDEERTWEEWEKI